MKLYPVAIRRRSTQVAAGRYRVTVRPPGGSAVNVSFFRGKPTELSSFSFGDPFGPDQLTLTFGMVTIFDRRGVGDLTWCVKEADIDVEWLGPLPAGYPYSALRWEGFIVDFGWGADGMQLQCVGSMHQLDGTLAKPTYPARPLPYEWAIARCFQDDESLRMGALKMVWPNWWKTVYADPPAGTPTYLIPTGVRSGDKWTGMLTRSTGSWDAMLTSYIQSLLSSMYTERGRFSLDLLPGRQPALVHQDLQFTPGPGIPIIDLTAPGISHDLNEDHSQSSTTLFGQGSSLSGVGYSGMQISPDGQTTTYRPLASTRQTWPSQDANGWYDPRHMRREVLLQLQEGLDEDQAVRVAVAHQQRFGEPGLTGTLTIAQDPRLPDGEIIPRHLIRAGMDVQIPGVFGDPVGLIMHVSASEMNFSSGVLSLTVDSKSRDQLTVDEVRARGRDALTVTRLLVAGGYQPPIPDQLLPWNYADGSGCIPSGPQLSSLRLFKDMPPSIEFPWNEWTAQRPPKAASWKSCYVHLGPASGNADKNWAQLGDTDGSQVAIPIKMAQAGTVRMIQLAAYDANGQVLPVDFHASLYYSRGANFMSTPMLPSAYASKYPPYLAGQHYPFFPNAWEAYNDDGTATNPAQASAVATAGLIKAWGNAYEKAGHYPGSFKAGDPATGLLVDETQWSFDCTRFDSTFDPYSATDNANNPLAGQIYLLIYCDAQKSKDVYFAGRIFRVEPGTTT